jgi:hypothetical protein
MEMVLIVAVHLWKEGLDETQAAIDFISAHQLDCKYYETSPSMPNINC